ncbi:MAG: hypothetical protein K2X81_10155, partial [Candidatus Obscuribacterales bacterium]|nr:hypothetical protein [Candidatus Obscuribacterales bacterium]
MKSETIVLAMAQATFPAMRKALGAYKLLEAGTLDQAQRLLKEPNIDMFVIGIHFDDSRAMEFVRMIRSNRRMKSIPILITRLLPTEQGRILRETLDVMKVVMAIDDYLELEGDPQSEEKIQKAVAAA